MAANVYGSTVHQRMADLTLNDYLTGVEWLATGQAARMNRGLYWVVPDEVVSPTSHQRSTSSLTNQAQWQWRFACVPLWY